LHVRIAAAIVLSVTAGIAGAQETSRSSTLDTQQDRGWLFEPRLSLSGIYTDNLFLAPEGLEEDDIVMAVIPGFSLEKNGGRFTADIDYQLESYFYDSDSGRNDTFNELRAVTTSELIAERFFVDIDASAGQSIIDPTLPFASSNVSLSQNRTEYWSAGANPYFVQPIGARTEARLDYRYGVVDYQNIDLLEGSQIDDFDRQEAALRIGTVEDEPGFGWSVRANHEESDYENLGHFEFDEALAELAFPIGRTFALVGVGGYESDFPNNPTTGGLDSSRWEAGFRWSPSARNRLEARSGERYFGTTYYFDWQMEARRTIVNVSYTEEPTTIGEEQLAPTIQTSPGPLPDVEVAPLTTELYTRKAFLGRVEWSGARNQIEIEANDTKREYLENPGTERETGIAATWEWLLGARTRFDVYAYGGRIKFRNTDVEDDLAQASMGITRQLGRRTLIDLSVRHDQRKSNSEQQLFDYKEDAAMLTILRTFGRGEVNLMQVTRPGRRT
jgi:hypothetical protein